MLSWQAMYGVQCNHDRYMTHARTLLLGTANFPTAGGGEAAAAARAGFLGAGVEGAAAEADRLWVASGVWAAPLAAKFLSIRRMLRTFPVDVLVCFIFI